MPRLFVAIDLPASVKERLSAMCCGLPGARWVDPDQIHLTLRFIGDVNSDLCNGIREALSGVHGKVFSIRLKGTGFFPPRGKPRVLWVGVEKNEQLTQIRNRVDSALIRGGLEPEGRKYSPHITLARLTKTPGSKVAAFLAHNGLFLSEEFTVNEFYLYSSVLSSKGAKHFIEEGYPLS